MNPPPGEENSERLKIYLHLVVPGAKEKDLRGFLSRMLKTLGETGNPEFDGIEGRVENCIVFRGARIGHGAVVKNSIIMQKCDVQENSLLENVICDKNVVITKEKWLKGAQNYPLIVAKNVVI